MIRTLIFLAALSPLTAAAQIYRCNVDGKTVFMDRPCAGDSTPHQVQPAAGAFDPEAGAAAQARAQRDRAAIEQRESQTQAARQEALRRAEADRKAKEARCNQIARARNDAEYWSREFRHPDNVRREQEKAAYAKEREFFECGRF